MRWAIYPGSFNPWHEGHEDVLEKALQVFDRVIIAHGNNPEKPQTTGPFVKDEHALSKKHAHRIEFYRFDKLLVDAIKNYEKTGIPIGAVIRGLRNGHDLQYEMNQQYWNEDLGLKIPIVYFITDRSLSHISSSAIRSIEKFRYKT